MFMMFAMTTDSVGTIIPEVIKEFRLSMLAAGAFHYAPMIAIAIAGIFLGFLADKLGRKKTIILGLVLFALNSYLFAVGNIFRVFPHASCYFRRIDRNFQNRRSGACWRYLAFHFGTHHHHEYCGRILRGGGNHRAGYCCKAPGVRFFLEMVVRYSRNDLLPADPDSPACSIPEDCENNGGADRHQAHHADDEESIRTGILPWNFSLCCCGMRRLRLDADAPVGLFRLFCVYGDLCDFRLSSFCAR